MHFLRHLFTFITLWAYIISSRTTSCSYQLGSCPNFPAWEGFILNEFLGHWTVIGSNSDASVSSCSYLDLSLNPENELLLLNVAIDSNDEITENIQRVQHSQNDSILVVSGNKVFPERILQIVTTDYKSSAVMLECQTYYLFSKVIYKILSRKPWLSIEEMGKLQRQVSFEIKKVEQDKCIIKEIPEGTTLTHTSSDHTSVLGRQKSGDFLPGHPLHCICCQVAR